MQKYYVTFWCGAGVVGSCTITGKRAVETMQDIADALDAIKKDHPDATTIISLFKLSGESK